MSKKAFFFAVLALGALVLAACASTPTPEVRQVEVTREVIKEVPVEVTKEVKVEVKTPGGVPYETLWTGSAHNNVTGEQFRHWDDAKANPDGVPTACAKCHTTAGYQDYLGADGSEALKVDKPVPAKDAQGIQCVACHNPVTTYQLTSVQFPGKDGEGNPIVVKGLGDSARCMVCHQGRESKASIDGAIAQFKVTDLDAVVAPLVDTTKNTTSTFGFRNIHYFAAAATLYGTQVKGGYEYDGQLYDWKHGHVDGYDTCIGCHDPHSLKIKIDKCAECHEGVKTNDDLKNIRIAQASAHDYDGDGNITEGMYFEIQGLQEILLAQIQKYAMDKTQTEIKYDAATYPYFLGANGKAFPKWTARLLKAAYNYQVSIKDPGAFAHGNKYIVQLLHDSIADLGGDVSKLVRDDAGHFAGNTMPFRDWDENGEVPFACGKCHSATGLPQFIKNGGSVVFNARGATTTAGIGAQPLSNGFMCKTCHDLPNFPNRLAVTTVPFPSGASLTFSVKDKDGKLTPNDSNLCIECHQGRESTSSMNAALKGKDADTVDKSISFKNIHYFGAGAALFGDAAKGWYQYAGQAYNGQYTHFDLGPAECVLCHDAHTLEVKVDTCAQCHKGVKSVEDVKATVRAKADADFDGDGNVTEGIKGELEGMQAALLTAIQTYAKDKAGAGIVYDTNAYPYWYLDKDGDGKADKNDKGAAVAYNGNWTPKLMEAAYNYQASMKDPGAFAHNGQYAIQVLYDAIKDIGGDAAVKGMTRPEAPAKK